MTGIPPALAPYVASLVAYDVSMGAPGIHRGLPSTSLTLVLAMGKPLDTSWAVGDAERGKRWATLSGLHSAPAAIHHDGSQRGIQLGLTLAGARALIGMPALELAGELVELEEVVPELADLPEQLDEAGLERGPGVVAASLTRALVHHGAAEPTAGVGRALTRLAEGLPVAAVADEVGYSRRRLSTLVREECGLSPKEYQRVARFERSRRLVGRRPLAEVAARCGYADQAHLARDWSALAGCPRTTWIREELPFVSDQDDAAEVHTAVA